MATKPAELVSLRMDEFVRFSTVEIKDANANVVGKSISEEWFLEMKGAG